MKRRVALIAGAALAAVVAIAVAVLGTGGGQSRGTSDRAEGIFDARREALFEGAGGEADRKGPATPAAEEVEDRAYPRSYVDDRRAATAHEQFNQKSHRPARAAFTGDAGYQLAAAATPGAWTVLGPVTADVPGESTQFFDPATQTGPATQESGRVTALAMDPNCGKQSAPRDAPCRLWVAAAGGGIWRTNDALAAQPSWIAPPASLTTNSFGSLIVDPNDASGNTLYAGSGEANGGASIEAGLGLFKSTDGGQSWQLVPGSAAVATNRSIGAVVVRPGHPDTLVIGTALGRHGASSVNGGRLTPPGAPAMGVYRSTDGGAHFTLSTDLQGKTPPSTNPPSGGLDEFQGGVSKIESDPHDTGTLYAAVYGYGVWRSSDVGATWTQVFQTADPSDALGDRTEFDAVDAGGGKTRIYLGDTSGDLGVARVFRANDAAAIAGSPAGGYDNDGWTELSDSHNGTKGSLAFSYCPSQCDYNNFVVSPASQQGVGAGHADELWLGGSMHYDELPAAGGLPRSNGRAVVRSTNAGDGPGTVTWADMTATLGTAPGYAFTRGMHPDQHAVAFAPSDPGIAFVGSDGGVVRVDVRTPRDASAACDARRFFGRPLAAADQTDCRRLLQAIPSSITPINAGLNTIQFQSLSFNPAKPTSELLGGTQDNGTFFFTGQPTWVESVIGDGGQSGFDSAQPTTRYHTYSDATAEVNFHGSDPKEWLITYDPLWANPEARSFYPPFTADPRVGGRAFIGLEHVWRTDDNGGDRAFLEANCHSLHRGDVFGCGDWEPMGEDLTAGSVDDRGGQFVVATERSSADTGTMWAATRVGRLWISKNADATDFGNVHFQRIDTPSTPGRFVSGIAIDGSDANHAWISYSGYGAYTPQTTQHVIEARYDPRRHRATFTDRSYDIGDQPVTDIARNERNGDLYAATDFGVLRLPRNSTQWVQAGTGLPSVTVKGLTLAQDAHVLYAATFGRGAYSLALP